MNETLIVEGYINIFKNDSLLNAIGGIYAEEVKAIEAGKCTKNYITTVHIYKEVENKE